MKRLFFLAILYFFLPFAAKAATEFVSVVDPGNGSGTDYTSLSAWENSFGIIDLTIAKTKVFSGTTVGTLSDSVTVYQCRSGAYQSVSGNIIHDTATQALVRGITNGAIFSANDRWYTNNTCSSADYYTISNTGDSAIAVAKCRTSTGAADTTAVTIYGWTTSATNYIKVWTDPSEDYRHKGKWDAGKYRLEVASGNALQISAFANNVRIEGIQVYSGDDSAIRFNDNNSIAAARDIRIAYNIVKGNSIQTYAGAILLQASPGGCVVRVYNNIIYDVTGTGNGGFFSTDADITAYVYNNTFANNTNGIKQSAGTVVAKNNIVKGSGNSDAYVGTFASGTDYNSTDGTDATEGGANSKRSQTFTFVDEANKDFHLSQNDTGAKSSGANLYADASLAITTDIDGQARPNSATTFDIGADEIAQDIYRSAAPDDNGDNSIAALVTGASNSMTIAGSTATFTSALPDNIGVGDVLQYDSNNNGSIGAGDVPAFIYARTDSTHYTVKTASGAIPTARAGDTTWSIFRAYTSLSNAEAGTENTAIDSNLRNCDTWSGGKDIVTSGEQWNIACYANGTTADQTAVTIDGWTTGEPNYINVFTPVLSSEVGVTQRHQGKWDSTKYNLNTNQTTAVGSGVWIYSNYVRLDGLQITTSVNGSGLIMTYGVSTGEIDISNCLLDGYNQGGSTIGFQSTAGITGKVWNNISYNVATSGYGIIVTAATNDYFYFYNNTAIGAAFNYYSAGNTNTVTVAKNNISQSSTYGFYGNFDSSSTNNLSDLSSNAPGSNPQNSKTVAFADAANNDFRLANSDTAARNSGVDLHADTYLPFETDIDGELRNVGGAWDIGADEVAGPSSTLRINGGVKVNGGVKIQRN